MVPAALSGCGGAPTDIDSGVLDSGVDGAGDGGLLVTPPGIPWLDEGAPPIMLAPCREGWREVPGDSVTECDPYPEGGAATCALGEAHFPGEAACRSIGDPCPSGDYATDVPTDGVVLYVKAGAPGGGDGSLASPYTDLSALNWHSLVPGTTVMLAKGRYGGSLPLRPGVQVLGACARDTVLTGVETSVSAVVTVTRAREPATVRNLSIVGASQVGVRVDADRALVLDGVLLDGVTTTGVVVTGAGALVTLSDTVVQNTEPQPGSLADGRGIEVTAGARLDAARVLVSGNRAAGIFAFGAATEVTLTNVVIRDTQPEARDLGAGLGIIATHGARVVGSGVLLTGNHDTGVLAIEPATRVSLSDAVVRDTQPREADDMGGRGITVVGGAHFDGARIVITHNHEAGAVVWNDGSTMTLVDAVVRDTQPTKSDDRAGQGITVADHGMLEGARLLVANNHDVGVLAADGARIALTDAVIRETRAQLSDGFSGYGVAVLAGAAMDGARLLVLQNRRLGIVADAPRTTVDLADAVIRDTQPGESDGVAGHGMQVQNGATVEGARLLIDGAVAVGLMVDAEGRVALEDTSIVHVLRAACWPSTCPTVGLGFAAAAVSATLQLTRFDIRDAATCGVFLAHAPTVDLFSGVIAESPIGACVQVDGYDLDRLTNEVAYRDNETNLDSTMLTVPEPIGITL